MSDPSMSGPLVIPDVVIQRLTRYFKSEALEHVINGPADIFSGVSATDYVRAGHTWDEVLAKYDKLFSYAVGP